MLENLGIVQLEAWDSPGSNLEQTLMLARRRLGGVTLLEWIARRVTDAELLDGTIVLLPGDENGPAASLASLVPPDVPVYFASGMAPLARMAQAVAAHPCRGVVTVGVNSSMVDPHQIDQLIIAAREAPNCDFIGFRAPDRHSSLFPRFSRTAALARLASLMTAKGKTQQPSEENFASFKQQWISLAAREERHFATHAAGGDDGWELAETIFDHLGHECFDGQWVADRPQAQAVPRPATKFGQKRAAEEVLDLN